MKLVGLNKLRKGDKGFITKIDESKLPHSFGMSAGEVESRLLEMGFIEGALLQVMHLGTIGRDPIAVRINNSSSIIALRKNEASAIILEKA
ncbi:MAG: ferrous iron transport protein [Burkholderiales bacterium]|jgi:ferrous iron transport protein A|nr:ferrous iron transport protein [Burkholderiales bacterium]